MKPRSAKAPARWRWLRLTQSNAASGSPRVADCTSSSSAARRPGSVSAFGLRPPPGRRMRCFRLAVLRNSASPRPIVLRATPVASDTAATPPRPAACASVAANSRRARSSRCGASVSNRALIPALSIIQSARTHPATESDRLPRVQPQNPESIIPPQALSGGVAAWFLDRVAATDQPTVLRQSALVRPRCKV